MAVVECVNSPGFDFASTGQQQHVVNRASAGAGRPGIFYQSHVLEGREADKRKALINVVANQLCGIRRR